MAAVRQRSAAQPFGDGVAGFGDVAAPHAARPNRQPWRGRCRWRRLSWTLHSLGEIARMSVRLGAVRIPQVPPHQTPQRRVAEGSTGDLSPRRRPRVRARPTEVERFAAEVGGFTIDGHGCLPHSHTYALPPGIGRRTDTLTGARTALGVACRLGQDARRSMVRHRLFPDLATLRDRGIHLPVPRYCRITIPCARRIRYVPGGGKGKE